MNHFFESLPSISRDPALNNDFYDLWMSTPLTIQQLATFARNYGAWVKSFPDALAILMVTTDDVDAKTEYSKTLFSEMGYGNAEKVHSVLLNAFFNELARRMGSEGALDRPRLEESVELLPSTQALIEGEQDLYRDRQMSFGAQLALEWQAYSMLRKLYEGARNYMSLWDDPDTFHESCEYFYAHIGATEKEHKEESLKAARQYAGDETAVSQIEEGYNRHLDLIYRFWQGLYQTISEPVSQLEVNTTRAND